MSIAILGWGSLLWDNRPEFAAFNEHLGEWNFDGPEVKLEFSRVSASRRGALTLVVDQDNGHQCRVAYATSKRRALDDAICDLRSREGTTRRNIKVLRVGESKPVSLGVESSILEWAAERRIEAVVWTGLTSNFKELCGSEFSIAAAVRHIASLDPEGKAKAAEYVWRAPPFVDTPLRQALQVHPWFSAEQV